jgi:hypothetical protein
MKTSTVLLLLLSCTLLATAGDKSLFQNNSQQIEFYRQTNAEMVEAALDTVRSHFTSYYEGDMEKLKSAWSRNGIVEVALPGIADKNGLAEFSVQRTSIDLWTQKMQDEIDSSGVQTWSENQFHPDHPLFLTVLNFTESSAMILVEDPTQYLMGPQNSNLRFMNNNSIIFKVVFGASFQMILSPLSNNPKILQMMMTPISGC